MFISPFPFFFLFLGKILRLFLKNRFDFVIFAGSFISPRCLSFAVFCKTDEGFTFSVVSRLFVLEREQSAKTSHFLADEWESDLDKIIDFFLSRFFF
jgi:hypothetical protein